MSIIDIPHILWKASKLTFFLPDKKSVTSSFRTNAIPPSLWNACDFVFQFNFRKKTQTADSFSTAAEFLSRLELKVTENIREDG